MILPKNKGHAINFFTFFIIVLSLFFSRSYARDTLDAQILKTPFGDMIYVLPEGYCLMDGPEGRKMSDALDRSEGGFGHAITQRFLPCSDRRRLYESKNWPEDHGQIRVSFLPMEPFKEGLDRVLWDIERSEKIDSKNFQLSQDVFGSVLNANPDPSIPESGAWVDDLRPVLRNHWDGVWHDILYDSLKHDVEGFPIGRSQDVVWWFGFAHETEHHVMARAIGTYIWKGFRVDVIMERNFDGVDTFDGLIGDMEPSLVASIALNGKTYWVPSQKRLSLENAQPDVQKPNIVHAQQGDSNALQEIQ